MGDLITSTSGALLIAGGLMTTSGVMQGKRSQRVLGLFLMAVGGCGLFYKDRINLFLKAKPDPTTIPDTLAVKTNEVAIGNLKDSSPVKIESSDTLATKFNETLKVDLEGDIHSDSPLPELVEDKTSLDTQSSLISEGASEEGPVVDSPSVESAQHPIEAPVETPTSDTLNIDSAQTEPSDTLDTTADEVDLSLDSYSNRPNASWGPDRLTNQLEDGGVDLSLLLTRYAHTKGECFPRLRDVRLSPMSWEQIRQMNPLKLRLKRCEGITVEELQSLSQQMNLAKIEFKECTGFTGLELTGLQGCESLKSLLLESLPDFDEDNIKYLLKVSSLEEMSLIDLPIQGFGLTYLNQMENLKGLGIALDELEAGSIAQHILPPNLELFGCQGLTLSYEDFKTITSQSQIKLFIIKNIDGLTADDYRLIADMKNLREIAINDCLGIDSSIIESLKELPNLEEAIFCFSEGEVPEGFAKELEALGRVDTWEYNDGEELEISLEKGVFDFWSPNRLPSQPLKDGGIDLTPAFENDFEGPLVLKDVYLSPMSWEQIKQLNPSKLVLEGCTGLNAKGFEELSQCEGFEKLTLVACPEFTGEELIGLKDCRLLKGITLSAIPDFNEEHLAHLKEFESLRKVSLKDLSITSLGLIHLQGVESLEQFKVDSIKSLTADDYHLIGDITNLKAVYITNCLGVDQSIAKTFNKLAKLERAQMVFSPDYNAELWSKPLRWTLDRVQSTRKSTYIDGEVIIRIEFDPSRQPLGVAGMGLDPRIAAHLEQIRNQRMAELLAQRP